MTTTKNPEQEVDELLESIWATAPYILERDAIDLAISNVGRLIEVLSKRCSLGGYTRDQIEHYQQVLSILKDKN